jgi:hypothetical protein
MARKGMNTACQNCSHVISRAWSDIGCWLGLFELAIPIILWQLDMPFKDYGRKKK